MKHENLNKPEAPWPKSLELTGSGFPSIPSAPPNPSISPLTDRTPKHKPESLYRTKKDDKERVRRKRRRGEGNPSKILFLGFASSFTYWRGEIEKNLGESWPLKIVWRFSSTPKLQQRPDKIISERAWNMDFDEDRTDR